MDNKTKLMIPEAISLIAGKRTDTNETLYAISTNGVDVPREYKGYIAAFGASILQAGLVPALAFYADIDSEASKDRSKILILLFKLLENESLLVKYKESTKAFKDHEKLLFLALQFQNDQIDQLRALKILVFKGIVAVKLGLRTFNLIKNEADGME